MTRGKYIVLEGPEGVGKTTQLQELARRLQAAGLPVRTLREPDSQSDLTARAIRSLTQDPRYPMNTNTEVLLYNAARSQSLQIIKHSVDNGVYCIVDRNYLTTLAIQYYGRGDVPDYETINRIIQFAVNGVETDLTILLDAPVPTLLERLSKRRDGDRFDNLDAAFLERVRAGYLWEANQRQLPIIFADGTSEEVANRIWKEVARTLSIRSADNTSSPQSVAEIIRSEPPIIGQPQTLNDQTELIKKTAQGFKVTAAGKDYLSRVVSNPKGNVYAFTNQLSPSTIAAAMARLSRRGDDMRIILLEEFANHAGKDEDLLKRVITAYGDDSVQQLTGIHLVVENASNILTKKLEWGRLAAYLEQSTRYIYYDQKDRDGNYRYYTPDNLKPALAKRYKKTMDQIFDIYSDVVHKLADHITANSRVALNQRDGAFKAAVRAQACDAARPLLPTATTSTVGIFASAQALESLIMHLLSDDFIEARQVGQQILDEARKIIPTFLERADKPERGGATSLYHATNRQAMKKLATEYLSDKLPDNALDQVTLTDVWPRNELDLVADMLYEHTNLPLKQIRDSVSKWDYDKKLNVVKTYIGERLNRRHRPGRAIEKAHYSWDIVCDYGIFRDLQRHRMVDDLNWQPLTPRFGYEIPELVEEASLSDSFESAFDLSLKLYSDLQAAGLDDASQYATLLGHRMRWKITYNAREAFHLHELRTSPQGHPGYRELIKQMHDQIANVHPMLAEAMIFVNKDEDPELTRLAAERYTKAKLKSLNKRA